MIDYETYTKIRNYYTQDHLRYSQIAARVGLDQRTVAIWANEKGRVENAVGYVKKNLLSGLDITDFSVLEPLAKQWLDTSILH